MTELWIGIALLTLLAVAFVYLPFLRARKQLAAERLSEDRSQQNIEIYRERLAELEQERAVGNLDENDFSALKTELERNLLTDVERKSAGSAQLALTSPVLIAITILALMVPVAGIGLYTVLGRSADLELSLQQVNDPLNDQQLTLEQAIAQLKKELQSQPNNPEGWFLLATTYMNQGRFAEGAQGFKKVLEFLPPDVPQYASVMGQYAQAMFFANGNKMTDAVKTQVNKTLEIDPFEITALGLLGIEAYEKQDYESALNYWLQALRNADGQTAESLKSGVRKARDELLAQGKEVPAIPELLEASIHVQVSLSAELLEQASPEDNVFVFAREQGGRMPLAAAKLTVADLPADITLDDSMAMSPQARLSSVATVEVLARVSKAGQPQAQVGDFYGTIPSVQVKGTTLPLMLVINKVVE
ncbi:MAG: c-type cytochrome biogenesis protein CcmI [Neptuniibacter caesariensis]|uniref:C-type cytochrome biogenesis protein CcmI n=1 Tax=Neptuniibacter caesariensis TaxID=207954 RepID=A0A2G6JMD7_NEPCE|nr:MAG: c-type cytochrome biogenesis protein CcmI [Neptuniibacter caesariensis]